MMSRWLTEPAAVVLPSLVVTPSAAVNSESAPCQRLAVQRLALRFSAGYAIRPYFQADATDRRLPPIEQAIL